MNDIITTAEDLDALPVRAVVLDNQGDPWVRHTASLGPWVSPETRSCYSERLARKWGPLTVLYRPGQPTEPARVLPSREEIEAALNAPVHAPLNTHDPETGQCVRCPWPVHEMGTDVIADAVLALFANAPTVEQVKAEALREAADELDRLMAIAMTPASRVGDSDKLAYHEWVEPRRSQELYATTDANWLRARADRLAPAQPTPVFEAMGLPTPEVPNVGGEQHG